MDRFTNDEAVRNIDWDVKLSDGRITYFDPSLSYEATGYRPIDETHGLDFNPAWFMEAANTKKHTGKYCPYKFNSPQFREFWTEEGWRCREGMTVNGYTLTGDNYYFINFYQLLSLDVSKAGEGRTYQTPDFYVEQYKYFHYIELARIYGWNCCTLKARGVGWSEINASIIVNCYTWRALTRSVISSFSDYYTNTTFKKVSDQMDYNNNNTEGGMRRLRQKKDSSLYRRASHVAKVDGQEVESGQRSEVVGLVVDESRKMRGDRTDNLIMEESGCHAKGTKVIMHDGRLKNVEDIVLGDRVMGDDGTPRTVIQLHHGTDVMYKISQVGGKSQIVNSNHIVYGMELGCRAGEYKAFEIKAKDLHETFQKDKKNKGRFKLVHSDKVSFKNQDVPIDPYIFGLWIGCGYSDKRNNDVTFSVYDDEIVECLKQYAESLQCSISVSVTEGNGRHKCVCIKKGKESNSNLIKDIFLKLDLIRNKDIPECYIYNSKDVLLELLAGIVDSCGLYAKRPNRVGIKQISVNELLVDKIEFICRMLGMRVSREVYYLKDALIGGRQVKAGSPMYTVYIYRGYSEIPCRIEGKLSSEKNSDENILYNSFNIEVAGTGEYYGFSLDGNQLFLLDDFTICHNSWYQWDKAYEHAKSLTELQGKRIGTIFAFGTGGDKGANLAGLASAFQNPNESGMLGYRHNNTKSGEYVITGFFVPAWSIIRGDVMDKRGFVKEADGKAFYQKERDALSGNPTKYLMYCAEKCWYPDEALALEGDNRFNTVLLTEQKQRITIYKSTPEEWKPKWGYLEYDFIDGRQTDENIKGVKFIPSNTGKICIIEPPLVPEGGGVYRNLYVCGIDGIDLGQNDTSEHTRHPSDFCCVIKKRVVGIKEPMYVAYYRDRPDDVREAHINCLKLILYYNAKALIEKTRITFMTFMEGKKLKFKYMMRRPKATMSNSAGNKITNEFGAPASEAVIQHGLSLVEAYVEEYSSLIFIPEMIDELITYSYAGKRKFDIVAAMQMAELADEELGMATPSVDTNAQFQPIQKEKYILGYYTDENGYKRRGRIKVKKEKKIYQQVDYIGDGVIYNSNPYMNGIEL